MATQVKYFVALKGIFVDESGSDSTRETSAVSFNTEADAVSFIENTLPIGEYTLHAFVQKS